MLSLSSSKASLPSFEITGISWLSRRRPERGSDRETDLDRSQEVGQCLSQHDRVEGNGGCRIVFGCPMGTVLMRGSYPASCGSC